MKYFLIANVVIVIAIIFSLYYLTNLNIPEPPPGSEKIIASKISNPEPKEVGENLSGEMVFTINASSQSDWIYFDFSKGAIVNITDRSSANWDIGFRRAKIVSNSGASNPAGKGGILAIENAEFESVNEAPESGYMTDIRKNPIETENPATEKWYTYDYMTHHLKPKKNVYVIRTADGKYAKMQIMGYYLDGAAGYYTIRYIYQGNGSSKFTTP